MNRGDFSGLRIDRSNRSTFDAPQTKLPKRGRGLIGLLILFVFLALGTYLVLRGSVVRVEVGRVAAVYPAQALTLLNATGYVVPQTKADVASKATGRLERLEVEEGMMVKKDQILARIENQDLVASMNQALANIEVARTNLKKAEAEQKESSLVLRRARTLVEKEFLSREAYDAEVARHDKAIASVNNARASIVAAEAAHRAAQVAVDYTLIRAPFDGVVLSKHADVGDVLAPFSPTTQSKAAVVSMADMATLQVEADVSESSLLQVKLGQPCEIQLDALPGVRFRGVVHRIVPTVDRTKATIMVKVAFLEKDSRILPEMSAKVAFLSRELGAEELNPVTAVPASALLERSRHTVALLVQGDSVKEVVVETDGQIGDLTVVKKGLQPADQVVLHAPEHLTDGSQVVVSETK